ncbi:MAG: hypothetical protein IJ685_05470 [Selenomonadaceae bacterium]|nr:hypothetical protein [Selenomonadaceae bacterium]
MSKKFFTSILVMSLMLIQASTSAGGYQKYLNGDANYIIFDGHQGVARYVVRNTLKVEADEYPYALLSIDWVTVPRAWDGDNTISARDKFYFAYDRNARKIYVVNPQTQELRYLPRDVSRAMGEAAMKAAELAFYLASGEKFYGFSNDFYPER